MKKLILLLLPLLALSACTAKTYTPVLNTDFSTGAVYKTGDFSYTCKIEKKGNLLSITPTSTSAEGMVISCDGREVTFTRDAMKKSFDKTAVDKTNPALMLWEIFSFLENANEIKSEKRQDGYYYYGTCGAGSFTLVQGGDSVMKSITVKQADIDIIFK